VIHLGFGECENFSAPQSVLLHPVQQIGRAGRKLSLCGIQSLHLTEIGRPVALDECRSQKTQPDREPKMIKNRITAKRSWKP
jgi:hypothetical protein